MLVPTIGLCAVVLAACQQTTSDSPRTEDIVSQIPWEGNEVANYALEDDDGDSLGEGTLSVATGQAGRYSFYQDFGDAEGNSDCWIIETDDLLKPLSVLRVIVRAEEEDSVRITADYGEERVETLFAADGEERDEDGMIPANAYDSLSEVFLVRTLDFVDGEEYAFNAVFTARPDGRDVADDATTFEVEGKETIEVAAGTYESWRIGVRGGMGQERTAWVEVDPPHQLVRFDYGFLIYNLTATDSPTPDTTVASCLEPEG